MSDARATVDALHELHGELARQLMKRIKDRSATAADFSAARQFLKDNNIEQARMPGTPINDLAATLPFAGSEPTYQ